MDQKTAAFMLSFLTLVAREGFDVAMVLLKRWLGGQDVEVEEPSLEAIEALKDEVAPLGDFPGP